MPKKVIKKRKNSKFLENIPLKFNNTIAITIIFVIFMIVGIMESVMYVFSQDNLKNLQNELSSDFIANTQVFINDINNDQYDRIKDDLNSVMNYNYQVEYVVVLDNKYNQIYSSLPDGSEYMIMQPNNPASFKLKYVPGMNLSDSNVVYVNSNSNNIYMGVTENYAIKSYMTSSLNFIRIFFGAMLLICLISAFMLAQSISKPMMKMNETILKIADGDLSGRLEYTKFQEINQLVQSYNLMATTLQRLYSTLENQVQDRTKELKNAYAELQNTQAMMVHSEKMKSLGELVAGIMHEINNPINFIYGNMTHLSNYSKDLVDVIEKYTQFETQLNEASQKEIKELKETIDYEFLKSDMPDLIKSCKEGADRAKNIIQDLKSFSRMEEVSITDVDLPHEIDMTLNILHNKLKNKAEIHKEYMENVPKIEAFGGQLNQVIMNILDNAACAIPEKGDIWIRLKTDETNKKLIMEIEDNGTGMDEEVARKVFDPFFTTKPVGQGTGLGMSITHKIIKNHQGDIKVESELGKGTKFIITLPLNIDRENLNASMVGEANG